MKKVRYVDIKDKGFGTLKALSDLEREFVNLGLPFDCVDEDDEYFKDKVYITDAIWVSVDGFYGMTVVGKRFVPKFVVAKYLRMLLWFAKHGAYEEKREFA